MTSTSTTKTLSICSKIQSKCKAKRKQLSSITSESRLFIALLIVLLANLNGCGLRPVSPARIDCISRTEGMTRPVKPPFDLEGRFIIDNANAWLEWESLLDMAQEDLRVCNR